MKTLKFNSMEQVNNVLLQIPLSERHPESGFGARQAQDGTFELVVPDDQFNRVKKLNPLKAAAADLLDLANTLRDQALDAGIDFQGKRYQTRPKDRENIAGGAQVATLAVLLGDVQAGDLRWHGGTEDFVWIDQDNNMVPMDAQTMIDFGKAVAARHSGIMVGARQIKNQIEAGDLSSDEAVRTAFADIT